MHCQMFKLRAKDSLSTTTRGFWVDPKDHTPRRIPFVPGPVFHVKCEGGGPGEEY